MTDYVIGSPSFFNEDSKFFRDVYIYGKLHYDFKQNDPIEFNNVIIRGTLDVYGKSNFYDDVYLHKNLSVGILTVRTRLDVGIGGTVIKASTDTGKVGIGSTVPIQKLDVVGNALFTGNIGIGATTIPEQRLDIGGSVKIDKNIYDSVNVPGKNGYELVRDERGIRWIPLISDPLPGVPGIPEEGIFILNEFTPLDAPGNRETYSTYATYATNAGIATYANSSGIATYSTSAGIATYATSSGISTYSTSSGIATYATSSGISTYATSSGISTYATSSGVSTSVIGGIASVTQLYVSSGIITAAGQFQSTQANNTANGGGQIYLNGATGNRIDFNTNGVAAPATTTRSVGTKIVLFPNISATQVDYALGIDGSTLWSSVESSAASFKWYAGITNIATLSGAGALSVTGTVSGTNITTGGNVTGSSASVENAATFNNGGAGAASGTTFNGSAVQTISYNTVGASPLAGSSSLVTTGTVTSGTWSGSFGAVSGANLTSLTAGNLSGTIPSAVLGNSTVYVGTTAILLNRASGAQSLTGITSIDGSSASCTGNAATATNLTGDGSNWSTNGRLTAVVGQLAWKNYGNSHTIFDASAGTSPAGGAVNNTNSQVVWSSTHPTLMGWNGANTYGIRVDSARIADTVTTNANLTGDVTSTGNATSIAAGVIVDADINASAAIVDTKLATISTAGKVSNSATTATNVNTASAIVARDASGNFSSGSIAISGNGSTLYGPNSTWAEYLRVGGNGNADTTNASVVTTNGNLHLDAKTGAFATYINYYKGTGGVIFGNGAGNIVGSIDSSGNLGLGVASPTQKLDVRGNFLLASDPTTSYHITQKHYTTNSGTLSWEGSAGQLFSITNNLTSGSIFSVNDVSGIPSIDVNADGTVLVAPYGGNLGVGTISPTAKLHVSGDAKINDITVGKGSGTNTTGTPNTAVGYQALISNANGYNSTAVGYQALYSNTTGYYNTANGQQTLYSNTTGYQNTATGSLALPFNTTGYENTATGSLALYVNTTGYYNTANGSRTLRFNTTGQFNTATGYNALYSNTTAIKNTANGCNALYSNTTGAYNTATGVGTLLFNTTGIYNTANGYNALYSNTTGTSNTAIGCYALYRNTTGTRNTAVGLSALFNNTTGINNVATGYQALYSATTASGNTANGYQALYSATDGQSNTATGHIALRFNTTGTRNTATGCDALRNNTTGIYNTANGYNALGNNTTGGANTATGDVALSSNTTGVNNTADGRASLQANTTGSANTANGLNSLYSNTTGERNTATGVGTLLFNTTGIYNTANGYQALVSNTTGTSNTAIGYLAGSANTTGGNNTFLGSNAVNTAGGATASNTIVLGDSSVTTLRCQTATISALSDARDKKDVINIPLGLDFLNDLRPVKFTWNQRDRGRIDLPDSGFIAQEALETVMNYDADWFGLVDHQNPEHFELSPAKLIPVLVKAVQELSHQNQELKVRIDSIDEKT